MAARLWTASSRWSFPGHVEGLHGCTASWRIGWWRRRHPERPGGGVEARRSLGYSGDLGSSSARMKCYRGETEKGSGCCASLWEGRWREYRAGACNTPILLALALWCYSRFFTSCKNFCVCKILSHDLICLHTLCLLCVTNIS